MPVEVLSDVARESVDMQTPVKQETLSSDGGNPLHSMHGEDVKRRNSMIYEELEPPYRSLLMHGVSWI